MSEPNRFVPASSATGRHSAPRPGMLGTSFVRGLGALASASEP